MNNKENDINSCSSSHSLEQDKEMNYITKLEKNILNNINFDKYYKKHSELTFNTHVIDDKHNKNKLWMLFYKRLFCDVISDSSDKLTELHELIFRINYVINQNINNLHITTTSSNNNEKFNVIDKYKELIAVTFKTDISIEALKKYSNTYDKDKDINKVKNISSKQFSKKISNNSKHKNHISKEHRIMEPKLSNYYLNLYDKKNMSKN